MTVWILLDYRWRECEVNSEIYSPVNQNPWCSCGWKAVRRERCSSNVYPLKLDVIAGRGGIGLHLNANKPAILALWFNSWKYWVLEVIFTGMSLIPMISYPFWWQCYSRWKLSSPMQFPVVSALGNEGWIPVQTLNSSEMGGDLSGVRMCL